MKIKESGMVFVLTADMRVIGLPSDLRFVDPEERKKFLLMSAEESGMEIAIDAKKAFSSSVAKISSGVALTPEEEILRFKSGGEPWWGALRPFRLSEGDSRTLWIGVVVPERDLVGSIKIMRILILVITFFACLIAVWRAFYITDELGRPIEALVLQSEKIRNGNLDASEPIESTICEVMHLARAQERMRKGLKSLLKLERDLQIAHQIQQKTFPAVLPEISGYEVSAWGEPAEKTGGDTYDVIGLKKSEGDGAQRTVTVGAERLVLLLADATGHGIGPALSITEVHAMLRMAVKMESEVTTIAGYMNEELYSDLHAGRFVTAWLGMLDPASHTLLSFSAGQAPLLRYNASSKECEILGSDAPPFGVVPSIDTDTMKTIQVKPGDIFAVISDGVFEATGTAGTQFGTERVIKSITENKDSNSDLILDEIKKALTEFAGSVPAADDRTALIIKRTAP
ncbi:MAG: SpoIIE family protein phosphatase, partial [Thermodesulfobacteriota bacterium]